MLPIVIRRDNQEAASRGAGEGHGDIPGGSGRGEGGLESEQELRKAE